MTGSGRSLRCEEDAMRMVIGVGLILLGILLLQLTAMMWYAP